MVRYLGIQRLNKVAGMFRHALTCLDLSSIGVCARLLKQYCGIHFKSVPSCVRRKAMDERFNIKFCFKLGKTATETHEMLVQVYGQDAVSRKCVYDWFARFRAGKESVDEARSGRP